MQKVIEILFDLDRNMNNGGQRYNNRNQNGNGSGYQGSSPTSGMYSMPPPAYMMQGQSQDGNIQSLLNNKFFQTNRPPTNNPCAYQSMGPAPTAYGQYAVPYAYQPYTPPTAAVQQ